MPKTTKAKPKTLTDKCEAWEAKLDRLAREYKAIRIRFCRSSVCGPTGTGNTDVAYALRIAAFELAEHYISSPED